MKTYDYTERGNGSVPSPRAGKNDERKGDLNPNAKLSNEQARRMRELRAQGWLHRDLAALFGVSEVTVSFILRGLSYKDAGGPIESKYTSHRWEK